MSQPIALEIQILKEKRKTRHCLTCYRPEDSCQQQKEVVDQKLYLEHVKKAGSNGSKIDKNPVSAK